MASSTVPGWVESLRIVLRESVGPSYSVMVKRVKLDFKSDLEMEIEKQQH